jgi:putative RNA 2'-phosphotransferase
VEKKSAIALSRFLSLVLRHKPETAGLVLDSAGWVSLQDLLAGST